MIKHGSKRIIEISMREEIDVLLKYYFPLEINVFGIFIFIIESL